MNKIEAIVNHIDAEIGRYEKIRDQHADEPHLKAFYIGAIMAMKAVKYDILYR
jgi:hypothetical protein